jgi:hypothetical protein
MSLNLFAADSAVGVIYDCGSLIVAENHPPRVYSESHRSQSNVNIVESYHGCVSDNLVCLLTFLERRVLTVS